MPILERVFSFALLFIIIFPGCSSGYKQNITLKISNWAYQLQNANPDEIAESGFSLVVMDYSRDGSPEGEYTRGDIQKIRDAGIIPVAYMSIGEAENYRFYWKEDWDTLPPPWLGRENQEWRGNYGVKYWDGEWKNILYEYIDRIINEGFMGIYLDKVDEYEYWADTLNGEDTVLSISDAALKMVSLINDLAQYAKEKEPGFYIIPQNGEGILKYDNGLLNIVSGWAAEDLFYNGTTPYNEEEFNYILHDRIPYLDTVLSHNKFVLSVDYVDDGTGYRGENKERIDDYINKARKKGYIPYVAIQDRELDELNIIEGIQP